MFPENKFLLQEYGEVAHGNSTTLFRKGRSSDCVSLPNYNANAGRTATLFEIFCAVLQRNGSVEEAKMEVAEVKATRLTQDAKDKSVANNDSDSALNVEVESILAPLDYDPEMIPADEEKIAQLLADSAQVAQLVSGQSLHGA